MIWNRLALKCLKISPGSICSIFTPVPTADVAPIDAPRMPLAGRFPHDLFLSRLGITPLNITACVHDSCWPKMRGDTIFNKVRELLEMCGVEIIELEHSRENALCCGLSAACSSYSIFPLLHHAKIRLKEFKKSGADVVVDYCGGCNWIFLIANSFSVKKKTTQPIHTVMEIAQMAIGETPSQKSKKRGGKIIRSLLGKVVKAYLSTGRYNVEELANET